MAQATMAAPQATPFATHSVFNQATPLENYNSFAADRALVEGVQREGGGWIVERAMEFGRKAGSAELIQQGFLADRFTPQLRTHDRYGNRIDEVEFHPAWHGLMALGIENDIHALPWNETRPGAHVARAALYIPFIQVNEGPACPITMTFAAIPALRRLPELAAVWEPRIRARQYDPVLRPAQDKAGVLIGMAMTEKQGGSDVRANTSQARPTGNGGPGGAYEIVGHKWFCSAPMCDAFLVLAQAAGGLSCFFVPRFTPDGARNALRLQRLKDKLGNRSNASSEIEFHNAHGVLIGEEGRGVATIIEMVRHTRLDTSLGAAAMIRHATAQAINHASGRSAFGARLIDQPLMANVLADLALESEAATALALRVAGTFDKGPGDAEEEKLGRLLTPIAKYWLCKRSPAVVGEALECHGGNGYVEESIMPRLYRDAPLNSIWEGSGNVQCLDVLRALSRDPDALGAYFDEAAKARGADTRFDAYLEDCRAMVGDLENFEPRARRIVERLALMMQGSLLVRHAPAAVADAFCASRLAGDHGAAFGTLPAGADHRGIVRRASPLEAA
ncbi:MAG: isovaleryl-CoA dehydrogenase [Reyranellaceae bacterium]